MSIAVSAAVVVLGAMLFILLGSQVELYRNVLQLRQHSGLVDEPIALDISAIGQPPSSVGLPAALDSGSSVVLFLSDKCGSCRRIAATLSGVVPQDLLIVIDTGTPDPEGLLGLKLPLQNSVIDRSGELSGRLNVKVTPAAIVVEAGRILRSESVPSARALGRLLDEIRASGRQGQLSDRSVNRNSLPSTLDPEPEVKV